MPYLLFRDRAAINVARARMEQRHFAHEYGRYEDDEDLTLPHPGHGEDLSYIGFRLADQSRGFYPPLQHQYVDLDPLKPDQRGIPYWGLSPYDVADGELGCVRSGCPANHNLPSYGGAYDASFFDVEPYGRFRRDGFGQDWLRFHTRDIGIGEFDEGSFRDTNASPRNPHSRRGLRGNRDMDLDHLGGQEPRVKRSMEPRLDNYDDDFDMGPREDRREFGRAEVRAAGRCSTGHRFEGDFEGDDLEDNFREARRGLGSRLTGYRSNLAFGAVVDDDSENEHFRNVQEFGSVDDNIEDRYTGGLRAPTVAETNHWLSLGQMHEEFDAEELRAEPRKQQDAQTEERYTTNFENKNVGRGLRDRRGRMPRAAESHPVDNSSDDDLEFPRGVRGNSLRPRQAGNRQTPQQIPSANDNGNGNGKGDVEKLRGGGQQGPSSYDSVTPTRVAAPIQTERANRPPVAAAISDNANPRPVAATVAHNTAKDAAKEVPRGQHHAQGAITQAKDRSTARDGAGVIDNSNNLDTAPPPPLRAARKAAVDSLHTSRAEVGDSGHSDSSDGGCDTPDDDDSETTRAGGDNSEGGGDVLQSFVRITL